jgi:hypothetical protein
MPENKKSGYIPGRQRAPGFRGSVYQKAVEEGREGEGDEKEIPTASRPVIPQRFGTQPEYVVYTARFNRVQRRNPATDYPPGSGAVFKLPRGSNALSSQPM